MAVGTGTGTGEVYLNPRCREKVIVRTPASRNGGARTVMDVYSEPGGAVSGEHLHPYSEERFTLVRGKIAFLIGGRPVTLEETGQSVLIQPGIKHRWWNCSGVEGYHICEIRNRSDRFEQLVLRQLFGLARDGKTTPEGMPRLLQQAVTTLEFGDVVRFTNPPWITQRALFGVIAPFARLLGYQGCYARYDHAKPEEVAELEELPESVSKWHYPDSRDE